MENIVINEIYHRCNEQKQLNYVKNQYINRIVEVIRKWYYIIQ